MGNPRPNLNERPELQVLPNRDGQRESSNTLMRDEVYAPKDLKQSTDRVQESAKGLLKSLDGVIGHLENAKKLLVQPGIGAGSEYKAAIDIADKVDQPGVDRELRNIKQLLQNPQLDLQTRRALVQEDADLQTLRRASGFTRANMALALIHNGDQAAGAQLLLQAQQFDRAMYEDPNFQRHFNNAYANTANQARPNYVFDQRDPRSTQLPGDVGSPAGGPQLPRDVRPFPGGPQLPQDVQPLPGRSQPREVPNPESSRLTPGSAAAALENVETRFKRVVQQGGDVRGAYQQLAPEFLGAIRKADTEFETANLQTSARDQQLQQSIDARITPAVKAQLQQIGAQIELEKRNLTEADREQWNRYNNPSTTDGERQAIQRQLERTQPRMAQLASQFESVVGKDTVMNMMTLSGDQEKMRGAMQGRFLTRFYFADAAARSGDVQNAQTQLKAAFEAVTPDLQKYYATQTPEAGVLARQVGLNLDLLPAPPDAVLSRALTSTNQGRNDAGRPVGTTDDTIQPPVANISSENRGLRADQIFDDARRSLQQGGMTEETKKLFADAIMVADSMYGPEDRQITNNLTRALAVGQKPDGSVLTSDERLQFHKAVQQEFARATLGMQYRMFYGQALNQNRQYASAEKIFKENIAVTDKLPLESFQAELNQLGKDVQDRAVSRDSQRDLFKMMQALQGQGTSRDDGLLFMPITARKQAAYFYVGGADGSGVGIVKPEQAAAMIDDAIAKEKSLYGIDREKVKNFDPTLANMAQSVIPLLPENLRKTKMQADSFWSNALVDGGVAAAAISGSMFIAGVLTKNGTLAKMGLASAEGTLNFGGKALVGASILGTATYGRHEVHKMITGENESWDKSLIHGTAGVGEIAALMGTRAFASKLLYGGAKVTPEAMLTRFNAERSFVGLGESAGKAPSVGDFFAHMGGNGRVLTAEQAALRHSVTPLVENGIVNAEATAALRDLSQPQLANLTQTFLKETAPGGSHWFSPRNLYAGSKELVPGALDLTTVSSANLGVRSFYSGYSSAFSALGTYSSVSSLDRPIDPKTGQPISYVDSFIRSNYRDGMHNTAVDSLWMGMFPIMKDGALARSVYTEGANSAMKAWGSVWVPLRPSVLGVEALGSAASYGQLGLKAGQMGLITTLTNGETIQKWFGGGLEARAIGHKLNEMQAPIKDQGAPGVVPQDTSVLNRSSQPAGQTDTPPTAVQDNGQPIVDQPNADLTRGTPGW